MLSRLLTIGLVVATVAGSPALAQSNAQEARFRAAQERFDREYQLYRQEVDRYQEVRDDRRTRDDGPYRQAPDRYENGYDDTAVYDPARDYRTGGQYRERVLSTDERVYAGYDGRYYCRRSDGTTGLIVGGAAGGLLGNVIDGGRSRTVGTLLGAAAGALAGRAVEQNQQVRCR
ncbi:glycine zipper 2TM domain-containing protein [Sphingomonas mollis]|uniref:17 kDa surface antigen n=1 Tax=Sphingomonas mollis TaxID=2795726 RepID=A0ABS0XLN8_9SPHN|nr:glycine zipper 2TM domain-containing protein [Sphingomonas sp. BT553]MBJ6120944.1 glycine zipper 2TM domain-containing protein [Sphingomonas sp. BT553]